MSKETSIAYKLAGFELTEFKPAWENYIGGKEVSIKNNIDFALNREERILKCVNDIIFLQGDTTILTMQFCTYVEIHPESIAQLSSKDKIVIPPSFLAQCASFGHGAIRGVMYLKTQNTPLDGIIMPPVEYQKVFKEPFIVTL